MAHEISQVTVAGQLISECAFAERKPAWHGLGQLVDGVPTSAEMILAAHLNWNVSKRRIMAEGGVDGAEFRAMVRDDTLTTLGMVTEDYQPYQNLQCFDFCDGLLKDGIMRFESAGALKGGRVVWVLARLPQVDTIASGDHSLRYILLTTTHDGTGSIDIIGTSVRVVCANTLAMALSGNRVSGIRHTGDMNDKLAAAHTRISQLSKAFDDYREQAQALATIPALKESPRKVEFYINSLFPIVTDKEKTRAISNRATRVANIRRNLLSPINNIGTRAGTWWSLLNAVTENVDHQGMNRGKDDTARSENRMISLTYGTGATFKTHAYHLACDLAFDRVPAATIDAALATAALVK